MADLSTVRAEIKSWEREFKAENGRAATVEDTKNFPHIQEKYKLYKRLSKAKSAASQPPATPPRTKPALLTTRPRVAEETAPLQSFNPFSPAKPKKQAQNISQTPRRNLFATPKKSKARSPSPDNPFIDSTSQLGPPSARTRARKRLRGEPVSPSPSKEKRRRITRQLSPSSNDAEMNMSMRESSPDIAYIDDSPVKAPVGGRSFHVLFDEREDDVLPITKLEFSNPGNTSGSSFLQSSSQIGSSSQSKPVLTNKTPNFQGKGLFSGAAIPQKSNLFATRDGEKTSVAKKALASVKKRRKSEMEIVEEETGSKPARLPSEDHSDMNFHPNAIPISHPQLLPPSPPPADISRPDPKAGKGKAAGRKKAKVNSYADEDSDNESHVSSDALAVHYVDQSANALQSEDLESDDDRLFGQEPKYLNGLPLDDHFDISTVPSTLLSVLAISPTSHTKGEDRLYRGVVYGRREVHYDADRGGEIWDVGEDSEEEQGETLDPSKVSLSLEDRGTPSDIRDDHITEKQHQAWKKAVDSEDDEWEGEPVPWEVGEL